MNRPFVPMFRDLFDTPIWKDVNCWRVYCYLCYRAAHKEVSLTAHTGRGSTVVKLKKGQVLFGRISAAKECGMTESAVRSAISKLERLGAISQKPATHYSVVTICDTMAYEYDSPTISQPTASQLPTNYHKQEYKDNREGKEEIHTGDSVESPTPKRAKKKVATTEQVQKIMATYPCPSYSKDAIDNLHNAIAYVNANKAKVFASFNNLPDYIAQNEDKSAAAFVYWRTACYAEHCREKNIEPDYVYKASNFFSLRKQYYLMPKWSNQ